MPDQAIQYGDYKFPALGLVYRVALATLKIVIVTTKDSNTSRSLRNRDEAGILSHTRYKPWSATDSLTTGNPALGVVEPEERKGSPARGSR